jgi:3-methyladenine DNA glycosylase AlkD
MVKSTFQALRATKYLKINSIPPTNMKNAEKLRQEAMNRCLCEIGIRVSEYTNRCIAIGEKIGRLDELSVSEACSSTYAPEWIAAGLRLREKNKAYT